MADFGTILKPDNNTLDLHCNSITTIAPSNNYAFAILATTTAAVTAIPDSPIFINWSSSQLQAYRNITIGGGDTTFTLEKIGNYLVDLNVWLNLGTAVGAQNTVALFVNGTQVTFDVGFGNGVSSYNYKGTLKAVVSKPTSAPVVISFRVATIIAPAEYRYAQLSITKLE